MRYFQYSLESILSSSSAIAPLSHMCSHLSSRLVCMKAPGMSAIVMSCHSLALIIQESITDLAVTFGEEVSSFPRCSHCLHPSAHPGPWSYDSQCFCIRNYSALLFSSSQERVLASLGTIINWSCSCSLLLLWHCPLPCLRLSIASLHCIACVSTVSDIGSSMALYMVCRCA